VKKLGGWKEYKLIELCSYFSDGNWIESKDQSTQGIRLIQTGNVGNGIYIDKEGVAKYISEETFCKLKCSEVYPNDILISRLPKPVGRACIVPDIRKKMITAVDCTIVRVNDKICDNKYLLYSLMDERYFEQINLLLAGSTRQRISRNNLGNIKIILPPFSEQKRIAKIIGKKLEAVEKAKQATVEQLKAAEALQNAYLREVFEFDELPDKWRISKLKDVCQLINGDAYKDTDWSNEGVPIIRIQNLNDKTKPFNYWAGSLENRVNISNGDLLLAWSGTPGTSFGAHIWNRGNALLNQHIFKVIYYKQIADPVWMKYAINQILDIMIERSHGAVGLRHITKSETENLEIPLPPLDEQKRIVHIIETKLNTVEKTKQLLEEQFSYINAFPSAILRKAFNGEL
jgi:type I restriction enzyme S subunit